MQQLATAQSEFSAKDLTVVAPGEVDDEISHIQADGFWGSEKGFHDAEQLRNERQSAH